MLTKIRDNVALLTFLAIYGFAGFDGHASHQWDQEQEKRQKLVLAKRLTKKFGAEDFLREYVRLESPSNYFNIDYDKMLEDLVRLYANCSTIIELQQMCDIAYPHMKIDRFNPVHQKLSRILKQFYSGLFVRGCASMHLYVKYFKGTDSFKE